MTGVFSGLVGRVALFLSSTGDSTSFGACSTLRGVVVLLDEPLRICPVGVKRSLGATFGISPARSSTTDRTLEGERLYRDVLRESVELSRLLDDLEIFSCLITSLYTSLPLFLLSLERFERAVSTSAFSATGSSTTLEPLGSLSTSFAPKGDSSAFSGISGASILPSTRSLRFELSTIRRIRARLRAFS